MRLQTLHPPVALILHPLPCLRSPFILAPLAEVHVGDWHVDACRSRVICSAMLRTRFFHCSAVSVLCWLPMGMACS